MFSVVPSGPTKRHTQWKFNLSSLLKARSTKLNSPPFPLAFVLVMEWEYCTAVSLLSRPSDLSRTEGLMCAW